VLDFTRQPEAVKRPSPQATSAAACRETNIGRALDAALDPFDGRPYTGSRIVMLVSDGGDRLDSDTRELLSHRLRKLRVSVYWLYLRSANGPA
jgi:mxaC protein